jgi:anion-transporting  ArsA/GET3 family ATPase
MSLLRTRDYIDIIELDSFVHSNYGWPRPGSMDSFHSTLCEALDNPGQNEMVTVVMMDDEEALEDYGEEYVAVLNVLRRLVEDGHLPEREEYEIEVWW